MIQRKQGATRTVFLTKKWAFKFPSIYGGRRWYGLLRGLLANMNEINWYKTLHDDSFCPIRFYIPGGFLVVMPRVEEFTEKDWKRFNAFKFIDRDTYTLPVELKADSFGKLGGKIVVIDYGNYGN